MERFSIKRVIVEEGSSKYSLGKEILKRLQGLAVERIKSDDKGLYKYPYGTDKEVLYLLPFEGEFLKPCPGTKDYICCGYNILNVGTNCPMDCSYCILQAYFNQPFIRVFVNLKEKLAHIAQIIDGMPDEVFRIGTGEFTDSLALDPVFGWSRILLPFFSERKNTVLELKTKSTQVEGLFSSSCRRGIVVSWSLNSPHITAKEEHETASLRQRLEAARRCQSEGFTIGLHFDPLIEHKDWKQGYEKAIDMLDKYIDPKGIIWMSLGCFRYMPGLKAVIRKRNPKTDILNGEFVLGLDGKMRYFKPIRLEMYTFMAEKLNNWYRDLGVYLCMESDELWKKSMGWSPENSEGLSSYLNDRVRKFFGRAGS
ncbi:MAG: DNA photolyase [Pseudomonadota bacterium]